jgi:hypothetical protein
MQSQTKTYHSKEELEMAYAFQEWYWERWIEWGRPYPSIEYTKFCYWTDKLGGIL